MDQVAVYIPGILIAYMAFVMGLMTPGPNVLAVIGTAMAAGRKPGTALALGIATGSFLWGTLTVAGLTALLTTYAEILTILRVAGGLYLLWLAFKAFRSAASKHDIKTIQLKADGGLSGCYKRGLAIQMTNPKAALTWIAILSLAVDPAAPVWVGFSIVLGTGVLSIVGHVAYALAFSTRPMVALYAKSRRWIEAALGAFFCFAGIRLLTGRS